MKLTVVMTSAINVDMHELEEVMSGDWFWDEVADDREMNDDEYMDAFTGYAIFNTDDTIGYSDATINCTPEQRAEILAIMKRGHKAWRASLAE